MAPPISRCTAPTCMPDFAPPPQSLAPITLTPGFEVSAADMRGDDVVVARH